MARRFAAVWPRAAGEAWPDSPGRLEAEEAWRSLDLKPPATDPVPAPPSARHAGSSDAPVGPPPVPPPGRSALGPFDPGRRGVRALAALAVIVVLVAAYLAWRSRPQAEPVPVTGASAPPTSTGAAPVPTGTIVVAVQGRVAHPGLYRLPAGSRVADALDAAGGALPGVDLSYVNLARKLTDGELILVGATPPVDSGAAPASGGKLDLNTATVAQLETLPGIGPALAQRIVDYRSQHGGFHSVDELHRVGGIGDAKFAQLKDLVTV